MSLSAVMQNGAVKTGWNLLQAFALRGPAVLLTTVGTACIGTVLIRAAQACADGVSGGRLDKHVFTPMSDWITEKTGMPLNPLNALLEKQRQRVSFQDDAETSTATNREYKFSHRQLIITGLIATGAGLASLKALSFVLGELPVGLYNRALSLFSNIRVDSVALAGHLTV